MGICESANNAKKDTEKYKDEKNHEKYQNSEVSDFKIDPEDEHRLKTLKNKELKKSLSKNIKLTNCPKLDKYERSLAKKSEPSIIEHTKSEISSKVEEEIIIKGEINKECPNKEKDFNNKSFMKLVKNNGGIILKEETQSNAQSKDIKDGNNLEFDIGKENLSEIKSQISFPSNTKSLNSAFSLINGKSIKNNLQSPISKSKESNFTFNKNTLNPGNKNENKSQYSTKTNKPKLNLNKYLNGVFNTNVNISNNNNCLNRNYNLLKLKSENFTGNHRHKHYSNNHPFERDSLISNNNNNTNDSSNTDLTGSFISIPKNDERISIHDLNAGENSEDIISSLS